ncbi:MAG: hypothetical protein JWM11_4985, partial [Planctomycetaceae bacterium]|nr:hypothetical protein [Planctomycetaceae bacterium]
MSQSIPSRRAAVSSGIILSLAALTAIGWAGLGFQGTTKTEKPTTTKPATEKPKAEKPKTEKPAGQKPVTEKPATEKPATQKPTTEKPKQPKPVGSATTANSAVVDKLLPAKPVFLYTWDGSEAHQKAWDATALQKALVGSGLYKAFEKLFSHFSIKFPGTVEPVLDRLIVRAIAKGASISVAIETISDQPAVQVTLVLPGAADCIVDIEKLATEFAEAPEFETISDRKVSRMAIPIPFLDGYKIGWWTEGEHLVIAGGLQAIEAAIDVASGKSANLSSNAAVQKLRKSADFDVVSVSLIDLKGLLDLVRNVDFPELVGSDKTPVKIGELLTIAGVDKLGMLTERWGFKGEAICVESDLEVPTPLTGLMTLFDQKPLTLKELPALPSTCEYFLLTRL